MHLRKFHWTSPQSNHFKLFGNMSVGLKQSSDSLIQDRQCHISEQGLEAQSGSVNGLGPHSWLEHNWQGDPGVWTPGQHSGFERTRYEQAHQTWAHRTRGQSQSNWASGLTQLWPTHQHIHAHLAFFIRRRTPLSAPGQPPLIGLYCNWRSCPKLFSLES